MRDFPNVRIGQVRRHFAALENAGDEDGASYRAIGALYLADWAEVANFIDSIPPNSTHAPSLRIKAYYHLHQGNIKMACTALARAAPDDWALTEFETWRRRDALGLRRASPFKPSAFFSVFAALKDEAEYLEEWLAHHALVGAERFYLYENNSTDATREIIENAKRFYDIRSYSFTGQPAQDLAMSHFLETHRHETEWAALIDADEFIRPIHGLDDVRVVLEGMDENVACVALNWLLFGSGGHVEKPDGLCVEAFTRRRRRAANKVKSIVRMSRVVRSLSTHQFLVVGPTVNAQGDPVFLLRGEVRGRASATLLAINHYAVKSEAQYRSKIVRGRSGTTPKPYDDKFFEHHNHNAFGDHTLAACASQIAEMIDCARDRRSPG
ncbi:MAG: glycosyltransferase family 2 protein [Hyphomonadaceae bacterium]|nr:glycosyltransferase family 2 protein [Hyphomonadaceae bacterium]